MFAQLHLFLQINDSFEKYYTKDPELGSMAFQNNLCTPGALLVLVYDKVGRRVVLYAK
jgi:hypothetical protein